VKIEEHLRLTESALKNWLIAQCEDSLKVGAMWYIGLHILGVPLAPAAVGRTCGGIATGTRSVACHEQ
jgi:predicted PurR-regulated permease PerM